MVRGVKFGSFVRSFPPADECVEQAVELERDGWDYANLADQLQTMAPRVLMSGDDQEGWSCGEQWLDPFALIAAAAQRTNRIEIGIGVVDAIRRSPGVLAQSMATLDWLSHGRCYFTFGTGENKQFLPYGQERTKPTGKLEESLRVIRALYDSRGEPISRPSEFWPLRDAVFPLSLYADRAPKILVAGGGPRIHRIVGELADGWFVYLPGGVAGSAQHYADAVGAIKESAIRHGRDAEALEFHAMVFPVLTDEDEQAERYLLHPMIRWTAIITVPNGSTWRRLGQPHALGIPHPFGDDWAFSRDFYVTRYSRAEVDAACAATPIEICKATCIWGSPKNAASQLRPFIEAGVTHVNFLDVTPWVNPASALDFPRLASQVMTEFGHSPLAVSI